VAGAVIAALASAGLAWWFSGADGRATDAPAPPPAAAVARAPAPRAGATPDEAQVRRAYEEIQAVFAETGPEGVLRFANGCAQALSKDARVLDYCLAFDLYAAALAPQGPDGRAWAAEGEERRLRLAAAALPLGVDAKVRLAELDRLTRQVSGVDQLRQAADERPAAAPAKAAPRSERLARAAAAQSKIRRAIARKPPTPAVAPEPAAPPDPCRLAPTAADRLVCGDPDLRRADQRMQRAYVDALAAGADARRLDREQADWRRARDAAESADDLAGLYARRIEDLQRESGPIY
jgi:uncharacterized protein YecT (DUF1311 family)